MDRIHPMTCVELPGTVQGQSFDPQVSDSTCIDPFILALQLIGDQGKEQSTVRQAAG